MQLIGKASFPNLMDFHPLKDYKRGKIFQIDGNLGGAAGIAEMLIQSHNGRIAVLPALPPQLTEGYAKGLRVRGNAEVNISWKDGALQSMELMPESDLAVTLCYGDTERKVVLAAGERYGFDGMLRVIQNFGS